VPGSTQPSILRGMVKYRVSTYGLSTNNNGDGGCGWKQPVFGRLTPRVNWLGMRVGSHSAQYAFKMNQVNSCNDSVVVNINIIIISSKQASN